MLVLTEGEWGGRSGMVLLTRLTALFDLHLLQADREAGGGSGAEADSRKGEGAEELGPPDG